VVVRATAAWRHHRLMRAWLRRVTVFAAAAVLTKRSRHVRRQSASALEAYGLQRASRTEPASDSGDKSAAATLHRRARGCCVLACGGGAIGAREPTSDGVGLEPRMRLMRPAISRTQHANRRQSSHRVRVAATAKAEATLLAAASWCLGFCTMRTGYSIWAAKSKAAAATRLAATLLGRLPMGATTAWALRT
jgi:hypothetical protein